MDICGMRRCLGDIQSEFTAQYHGKRKRPENVVLLRKIKYNNKKDGGSGIGKRME